MDKVPYSRVSGAASLKKADSPSPRGHELPIAHLHRMGCLAHCPHPWLGFCLAWSYIDLACDVPNDKVYMDNWVQKAMLNSWLLLALFEKHGAYYLLYS